MAMDLETRRKYKGFMVRALMAMAERPDNPPTVDELAAVYGCDAGLLRKLIFPSSSEPPPPPPVIEEAVPSQKLRKPKTFAGRMRRAARLLRNTNTGLWTVAESVGFSSLTSFSSAFEGCYGMTPQQFRENHRPIQ
jgi:AraC-like DNA-binding protein